MTLGMPHNYRLNPPASRVTAFAEQGPRHSGRGLAVRWADPERVDEVLTK